MEENCKVICSTESKPLSTLEELLDWKPLVNSINCNSYTVSALQTHKASTEIRFKALLCHDMKGGYLDDRFNDGCGNQLAYRFFHWSNIDAFVYFSHHFVTIPPIGWINAAHRNGVPVLGTLIVEGWTEGKSIFDQILNSTDKLEKVLSQLVEIAKYYHFDGWLVNIECEIESKSVETLVSFVELLTDMMHKNVPQSLVIWYDSVTNDGNLNWQNELNSLNKCFFDVCDAIFLNYSWNQSKLEASYKISQELSRNYDVYVGVDVFGRGCFGGGGFNTNLATNEILKYGLSMAIFAPGWVYEQLGCDHFTENECLFWSSLKLGVHHYPNKLPICTSFCQGFGSKLFKNGQIVSDKPWYNLSLQQLQPSNHAFHEINLDDAYNGGGSLKMRNAFISLFKCDVDIKRCIYAITYKSKTNQKLTTIFNYKLNDQDQSRQLSLSTKSLETNEDFKVERIENNKQVINKDLLQKYGLFENENGWVTDCFIFEKAKNLDGDLMVKSIDLHYTADSESQKAPDILIGQLIFDSVLTWNGPKGD